MYLIATLSMTLGTALMLIFSRYISWEKGFFAGMLTGCIYFFALNYIFDCSHVNTFREVDANFWNVMLMFSCSFAGLFIGGVLYFLVCMPILEELESKKRVKIRSAK